MKKPATELVRVAVPTSVGTFMASYSETGLCGLDFPSDKAAELPGRSELPTPTRSWHALTTKAVEAIVSGKQPGPFPPLDLDSGTEFQQRVWNALRKIAFGRTCSYAEIAAAIGRPNATRAVGGACGANPIPVLIPCHRVVAANQKLGGFSGGLHWKRLLLQRERA